MPKSAPEALQAEEDEIGGARELYRLEERFRRDEESDEAETRRERPDHLAGRDAGGGEDAAAAAAQQRVADGERRSWPGLTMTSAETARKPRNAVS
jgi:hypothetical protein